MDGKNSDGPQRETRAEAQADLDRARQCKSRPEMKMISVSLAQQVRKATTTTQDTEAARGGAHPAGEAGHAASARSSEEDAQPRKRLCVKTQAQTRTPSGLQTRSSGVPQPVTAK